jgi:hypothetical protein
LRHRYEKIEQRVSKGYNRAARTIEDNFDEYPLAMALGAFATGILAGVALPNTRREDRLMGRASDKLKSHFKEVGSEAIEQGEHIAQATVAAAKSELLDQNLDLGHLKEKAGHIVETATDAAKETLHAAKDSLKESAQEAAGSAKAALSLAKESIKDTAKDAAASAKGSLQSAKDSVKETLKSEGASLSQIEAKAETVAKNVAETAKNEALQAKDEIKETAKREAREAKSDLKKEFKK